MMPDEYEPDPREEYVLEIVDDLKLKLAAANARADAAESESLKLAGLLAQSKRRHYHVEEDCWYCCPACEDYCGDKEHQCICIADEWNAKIDAALAARDPQAAPPPEPPQAGSE